MVKAEIFGPDTYDSCANRVKNLTGILLIFHPGCGHCVQMRPAWEQMKQRLPQGSTVVELDGSAMNEHEGLRRHPLVKGLKGFPSVFQVKKGALHSEYQGPRTVEEMFRFASQMKPNPRPKLKVRAPSRVRPNPRQKLKSKTRSKGRKIDTRKKH